MKKIVISCLTVFMVVIMAINAFAAPVNFLSSPSGKDAPVIVEYDDPDDDCTGKLIVTGYGDRDELSEEGRKTLEKAYETIVGAENLKDIVPSLEGEGLSVSDLFDLSVSDCGVHENHGKFDITLSADSLKNFAGLMYFENGAWKLVENAKVEVVNGEYHLIFSSEFFGAYAIVVDTDAAGNAPQTGDNTMIGVYAVVMAVSALAIVLIVVKTKKQRA